MIACALWFDLVWFGKEMKWNLRTKKPFSRQTTFSSIIILLSLKSCNQSHVQCNVHGALRWMASWTITRGYTEKNRVKGGGWMDGWMDGRKERRDKKKMIWFLVKGRHCKRCIYFILRNAHDHMELSWSIFKICKDESHMAMSCQIMSGS